MSQNITRRSALVAAAAASSAAITGVASAKASAIARALQETGGGETPKKLLMLGGTRFLGPTIVSAAVDAGWEVTLFNRGKSSPDMFEGFDKRVGDRNTGDYASLSEGEWDLCIDTSCYIPSHVTAAVEAVKGRVKHYVVVSTLSVFAEDAGDDGPVDENGKISQIEPEKLPEFQVIQDVGKYGSRYYGALKFLCEEAAKEAMPEGATTIVRPGLIVGPEDGSDRFTYWPVRLAKGGEVLAPGKPETPTQYIDVRDLGVFTFDVGARGTAKTYNAVGFDRTVTMKDMIESCILKGHGAPEDLKITWVDDDFLLEQGVGQWMELPLWIAGGGKTYSNAAAIQDGLKFSPLADTASATLRWFAEKRGEDHQWRAALKPEKEAKVLEAWHAR
ncbi:MAG: epimerase [Planctomycetota bacterium]